MSALQEKGNAAFAAPKQLVKGHPSTRQQAIISTSGGLSGPFIGGRELQQQVGSNNKVKPAFDLDETQGSAVTVTLVTSQMRDQSAWQGFTLGFPIGAGNETSGFGAQYTPNIDDLDGGSLVLNTVYTILVQLPNIASEYKITKDDVSGNTDLPDSIRVLPNLTRVRVNLVEGGAFTVQGYGIPFANPGHASDDWINCNAPIIGGMDLLSILRSQSLTFLVAKPQPVVHLGKVAMPPPSVYPYNYPFVPAQPFALSAFADMIEENKGDMFRPVYTFDDDMQSVCSTAMAHVQDIYWLCKASENIRETEVPAYFVRKYDDDAPGSDPNFTVYFAIVRLTETFREQHKSQWGRLTKDGLVRILLPGSQAHERRGWLGCIMQRPCSLPALEDKHALKGQYQYDIVVELSVRGGDRGLLKTFEGRALAEEAFTNGVTLDFTVSTTDVERKVKGAEAFVPGAEPVPSLEDSGYSGADLKFRIDLARDVMRGGGFYNTLSQRARETSEAMTAIVPSDEFKPLPSLPSFNFIDVCDPVLKTAILEEMLPADRDRFEVYCAKRDANIMLITAPGGTGKTSALSTACHAAMNTANGGNMYGTGPTNSAVGNFSLRQYVIGLSIAKKCNAARPAPIGSKPLYRAPLVICGYSSQVELEAIRTIFRTNAADNSAYKTYGQGSTPQWQFPLTPTNWLLVVLGFLALEDCKVEGAVTSLLPEHPEFLHELRAEIQALAGTNRPVDRLLKLAKGEITYEAYSSSDMVHTDFIEWWIRRIIDNARSVNTIPSDAQTSWYYSAWARAKFVAVDEAGCMHKADLCSVWGNTLRTLILAGDIKQLRPPMMELNNIDANNNAANRFAMAGRFSALAWFLAAGFPTFRLLQQLRMCNGMFDFSKELFYTDYADMTYGPWSDPTNEVHAVGVAFEKFMLSRRSKRPVSASPKGTLAPIFYHTPHTHILKVGTSKLNRMQVKATLDLLAEFVMLSGVSPKKFVVISAYKPNVGYGNRILRNYPILKDMPPLQTADSFHGREGDLSAVITGTKKGHSAGFVSKENRLNVMITRQKSALLIVGDMLATGPVEGDKKAVQKADKEAKNGKVTYETDGTPVFSKVRALRSLIRMVHAMGRIYEPQAVSEEESEARDALLAAEEKKAREEEEAAERAQRILKDLDNRKYGQSESLEELDEEAMDLS